MNHIRIFISSVQSEFAQERAALRDYLRADPLMRRFFGVFLFEDVPALDRRPDALYLDEVKQSDVYVGLFGNDYGSEDIAGASQSSKRRTTHKRGSVAIRKDTAALSYLLRGQNLQNELRRNQSHAVEILNRKC